MQVYRGLDIGTGKPTAADRAEVPHHLLDVVDPDEPFFAARWADEARGHIAEISRRGHLPVVVGGTGLYFRALERGLFEAPAPDPEIRRRHQMEAQELGPLALHRRLSEVDPEAAARILPRDLLRISRALEVFEQTGVALSTLHRAQPPPPALRAFVVVLEPDLAWLRGQIATRVRGMLAEGFLEEIRRLRTAGFARARALEGLGYKQLSAYLDRPENSEALAAATGETIRATVAYAKRQRTWFRRQDAALRLPCPADAQAVVARVAGWAEVR